MASDDSKDASVSNSGKLTVKVYNDLASPAARAVGSTLAEAVRTALRPVEGVIWTVDRSFDWLAQRITARWGALGRSSAQLSPPPVQIEGAVIQAVQVVGPYDDPLLRNFFASLLAEAMTTDKKRPQPSMISVLRQIAPDEARLIALISATGSAILACNVRIWWTWGRDGEETFYPPEDRKMFEENVSRIYEILQLNESGLETMLENLIRLGVVSEVVRNDFDLLDCNLPSISPSPCPLNLWQHWEEKFKSIKQAGPPVSGHHPYLCSEGTYSAVKFTNWGKKLSEACGAESFFDPVSSEFQLPDWAA